MIRNLLWGKGFGIFGIIEGTKVECILISPGKNPKAYMIKGAVIAIRNEDAKFIKIERGVDGGGADYEDCTCGES